MYYCEECENFFNNPITVYEDRTPYGGPMEPGFLESMIACPHCSSTSLSYAQTCRVCDKNFVTDYPYADDICEECEEDGEAEY